MDKASRQKINKEREDLHNTVDQMNKPLKVSVLWTPHLGYAIFVSCSLVFVRKEKPKYKLFLTCQLIDTFEKMFCLFVWSFGKEDCPQANICANLPQFYMWDASTAWLDEHCAGVHPGSDPTNPGLLKRIARTQPLCYWVGPLLFLFLFSNFAFFLFSFAIKIYLLLILALNKCHIHIVLYSGIAYYFS